MAEYVDLSERVTATFYSDEYEEWTQQTVTVADVLDSVCDDYTVLPSAQPERKHGKTLAEVTARIKREILATFSEQLNAQPERKTGRWILHENQRQEDVDNGNYLYICSECGKSDIHAKTQEVPFCWWCGAKMEV